MRRTGSQIGALVALVFALVPGRALAVPSIEAELSPQVIALGEEATFTLVVTDAAGGELSMPRFGDLQVGQPSENNQSVFTFQGGQQTFRVSRIYTWSVRAPREGTFLIGPATLKHNGETYRSNGVELKVEGQAAPRAQPQRRRSSVFPGFPSDPFDDFDPFGMDPWGRRQPPGEQDVLLRAVVDKEEAFLGEQVTLSLYLYSQTDVAGVSTVAFPKLDGFWAEDLESPTQLVPELKQLKGATYRAYLLRRRALFPLRAGDLSVDPVEAQVNLGMGLFRGAAGENVKRKSPAVLVRVKPLPADGQPPGFEAAHVGRFGLSAQASPQQVALGQPVQLRVVLEGQGNVKGARVPRLVLPEGLKTYDPTVTDKVKVSGTRYAGTKSLEWVVIPERTGEFVVPPIEFPFFDPAQGAYETARTQAISINVVAGAGGSTTLATPNAQVAAPAANVLGGGLRPIRLHADVSGRVLPPLWKRGFFWPLVAAPVVSWAILVAGLGFAGVLRRRDPNKLKVKRARGAAAKRLRTARDLLGKHDAGPFLAEVIRALQQFVADKTGVAALGLTRDELGRALRGRGFPGERVDELVKLLETCETARFSPGATSPQALARVLEDGQRIIDALDGVKPTEGA